MNRLAVDPLYIHKAKKVRSETQTADILPHNFTTFAQIADEPNDKVAGTDANVQHFGLQSLSVKGQGTATVVPYQKLDELDIEMVYESNDGLAGFGVHIEEACKFYILNGDETLLGLLGIEGEGCVYLDTVMDSQSPDKSSAGIERDNKHCTYWLSLDRANRRLSYGKGELRLLNEIAYFQFPPAEGDNDPFDAFAKQVCYVHVSCGTRAVVSAWRDPVTIEPPLFVVPTNTITMEMAANGEAVVPSGLPKACQVLYGNVSGDLFVVDPLFATAVQRSITDENGWCYKKLREKSQEFGEDNPEETYLRITLGVNQGNSPGIPYVMEIWPAGHYSPIHNHANAEAIIRVLYGSITVNLFRMLYKEYETPFATRTISEGSVTWLTEGLNQTHQLKNETDTVCVTIQCYAYAQADNSHYEYFDYLDAKGNIGHFSPNSDMDYISFKNLVMQEYYNNLPQ